MMQTGFLFPIAIAVGKGDLAWQWAWWFHGLTIVIVLGLLPLCLSSAIVIVTLVSLRSVWDAQAAIRRCSGLAAAQADRWYLILDDERRDYVQLYSVSFAGSYMIISLKRNGSNCHIVARHSKLPQEQVHKFRLISLNPVSA